MGQPVQRFRKDVLHVGKLSHPTDGWKEDFTPERLKKLADETNRLIAAGHEPHLPEGHLRYVDPAKNHGFHKRFEVDGDRLMADVEIVGEKGLDMAARNKVSVFIEPEFKDSKGNKYGEVITHVALTPVPVQGGQGEFVAIAAAQDSKDTINVPVLRLDSGNSDMTLIEEIAKLTGKTLADEAAAIAALQELATNAKLALSLKEKVAALEADGEPAEKPSPMLLKLCRENRDMKLSQLVKDARITPAVRDRLAATWAAKDGDALALSMDDNSDKRFDDMIAALGENDPVKLGEQTNAQTTVALSRSTDAADDSWVDKEIEKSNSRHAAK